MARRWLALRVKSRLELPEKKSGKHDKRDRAFRSNKIPPLFWFALTTPALFAEYVLRVKEAVGEHSTWLDRSDLPDIPNWEIPWEQAQTALRTNLRRLLSDYPSVGTEMLDWVAMLNSNIRYVSEPIVILEWQGLAERLGSMEAYLKELSRNVSFWTHPDESRFTDKEPLDLEEFCGHRQFLGTFREQIKLAWRDSSSYVPYGDKGAFVMLGHALFFLSIYAAWSRLEEQAWLWPLFLFLLIGEIKYSFWLFGRVRMRRKGRRFKRLPNPTPIRTEGVAIGKFPEEGKLVYWPDIRSARRIKTKDVELTLGFEGEPQRKLRFRPDRRLSVQAVADSIQAIVLADSIVTGQPLPEQKVRIYMRP